MPRSGQPSVACCLLPVASNECYPYIGTRGNCGYNNRESQRESLNTEVRMRKDSAAGRALGILAFLLGIGILVAVAVIAYNLFNASGSALTVTAGSPDGTTSQLGASAIRLLYRLALLIILCIAGSLVAARGLHLYFVATGSPIPGRRAGRPEDPHEAE